METKTSTNLIKDLVITIKLIFYFSTNLSKGDISKGCYGRADNTNDTNEEHNEDILKCTKKGDVQKIMK